MAPHSSTLAWKIPWTKEPGRQQSMRSLRVGHDWVTSISVFTFLCIGQGNGNPLQCSCLENPRDGEAWWAAVYGVAQSRTRLKQLRSIMYTATLNSSPKRTSRLRFLRFQFLSKIWIILLFSIDSIDYLLFFSYCIC